MDKLSLIAIVSITSIITAGITMSIGVIGPSLSQGKSIAAAMNALAQQPDASPTITRTLYIGLAMIESMAIYCFVIAIILLFANPFWSYIIKM